MGGGCPSPHQYYLEGHTMAYRISTRMVFTKTTVGTTAGTLGGTNASDPIDLRDISRRGDFSLSYVTSCSGVIATAGTTNFTYLCSDSRDGTFTKPSGAGTIGTTGAGAGETGSWSFTPVVTPFMKIQAIQGTAAPAVVTAHLNVR